MNYSLGLQGRGISVNNMLQYYCTLQLKSQCLDPVTSKAATGLISFVAGLLLFLRAPTMKKNNKTAALDTTDPEDQSFCHSPGSM